MTYKVKITHSAKSRVHASNVEIREGKVIYKHPEGRFIVLEIQGIGGKYREAFWPEEIVKVGLFYD
jgi:hypothetical protein